MELIMKKKIFAIDDEHSIRFIIENTFKKDFEVVSFQNGELALKSMQTGAIPDLIICDIMMPVLDGYGVLHLLNKNETLKDIPFVFLTAKTMKEDEIKGLKLGAVDYVYKPFNLVSLKLKISKLSALRFQV